MRRGFRVGDYLMVDDESGLTHYASEMVKRWDGAMVHRSNNEPRHPQEFVKAYPDPEGLTIIRPDVPAEAPTNVIPTYVGATNIPAPTGPASHLFDPGIGDMIVGTDFVVR